MLNNRDLLPIYLYDLTVQWVTSFKYLGIVTARPYASEA